MVRVFSVMLWLVDIREIGLYEVPMFMSVFGFGIGMRVKSSLICWLVFTLEE